MGNPQFAKGYSRQAHALFNMGRYVEMEAAAKKGLEIDSASVALQDLLKQAEIETKEPLAVQQHMYQLRQDKKKDANMQEMLRGLNMGGNGIPGMPGMQMFSPDGAGGFGGGDLSGLLSGLGGGGGGGGGVFGGGGGNGKARMTEDQMRSMARAMKENPAAGAAGSTQAAPAAAPAPAAAAAPAESLMQEGPTSLGPK